ncbi:MAG: hypothetical protein ACLR5G_04635 [Eubacteriales bacterium]
MPRALAALRAATDSSAADSETAGVMPEMWNHSTPSSTLSQSMSPGFMSQKAEWARS